MKYPKNSYKFLKAKQRIKRGWKMEKKEHRIVEKHTTN
jgi:hypothetical protein